MPEAPWNAIERGIRQLASASERDKSSPDCSPAQVARTRVRRKQARQRTLQAKRRVSAICSCLALVPASLGAVAAPRAPQQIETAPLIWRLTLRDARVETRLGPDGLPGAHFEVTIVNGAGVHVRRLYLTGTLRRGGSSKRGAFVWHLPGGLSAGKTARLDLTSVLSVFLSGAKPTINARDFKVEVIGFEDETGRIYGDFALK